MILIDSDVLIDYLKGRETERRYLDRLMLEGAHIGTTSVNAAEIWRGSARGRTEAEQRAARDVIAALTQVPFGPRAAERFGRLMADLDASGQPLPVADGMVAAIAIETSSPLVTRNTKHFERVEGLVLQKPDPTQT